MTRPHLLILKASSSGAPKKYAHQPGYYLLNGRWNKIAEAQGKVPAKAPKAKHLHGVGKYAPAQHFTDDEWGKLKLPDGNVNAGAHNAKVDQLKQLSESGNVAGILAHGYGTNTYGKKQAAIANTLLSLHGSPHKVEPGQKAGEHSALQSRGVESPAPKAAPSLQGKTFYHGGADVETDSLAPLTFFAEDKAVAQDYLEGGTQAGKGKVHAVTLDIKNPASDADVEAAAKKVGIWNEHENAHQYLTEPVYGNDAYMVAAELSKQGFDGAYLTDMPMSGGKPIKSAVAFSKTQIKAAPAETGDASPKDGDTKEGADGTLVLKDGHWHKQGGDEPKAALVMPAFQQGKKAGAGVVDYYEKIAAQVIDAGKSGAAAYLTAMKEDGLKPSKKGKVSNTWAGKTANSKLLLALHAEALARAKGEAPQQAPQAAEKPKAKPAPAPAAEKPASGHVSDAALDMLDQIPWDKHYTDSKANAGHNKHVDKIKGLALTGDVAGLQEYAKKADAKQTYSKKQGLLALLALEALKAGEVPKAAAPAEPPSLSAQLGEAGSHSAALGVADAYVAEHGKSADTYAALVGALNDHGYDTAAAHYKHLLNTAMAPEPKAGSRWAVMKLGDGSEALKTTDANGTSYSVVPSHNGGYFVASVDGDGKIMKDYADSPAEAVKIIKDTWHGSVALPDKKAIGDLAPPKSTPAAEPASNDGPQEGDTKQGADGMLVFHNGRWHKQDDDEDESHPIDGVTMPDLSGHKSGDLLGTLLEHLKDQVKKHGASALKGTTKKMKATGALITTLSTPDGTQYKVKGYASNPGGTHAQIFAYVETLKTVAGPPGKKPKAKPQPAPAATAATAPPIAPMDGWKQTGGQGGSNPGGKFKDEAGVEWYCKFPPNEDHAKSEVLAAQLYALAGIPAQDAKLITKDGKLGIASRWTDVKKATSATLAHNDTAIAGFAVDAWLGNWDAVGLAYDNLQIGKDGKAVRIDAGGSLQYRAQGKKKAFGNQVVEIDSLRDHHTNPQAAAVFGHLTEADITASVAKVLAVSDADIKALVEAHAPGSKAERAALAATLIARKADLAAKYPKAAKGIKMPLDPANLPVDASRLPEPHDFHHWLETGKGLSSHAHINEANIQVEKDMLAVAAEGNLPKLKAFEFAALNKETGQPTGTTIPIDQHPSKHVVQFHADLVTMLEDIADPPEPLKEFAADDVGTLEELSTHFKPKKFGTTVAKVGSNEKLGFWVVLGGVKGGAAKFMPKKVSNYSTAAIAAAMEKFKQAKPLAKHFIKSIQASGSYNDLFRDGKTHDHAGNKLTDVAKAALEHATEMPEGTSLYRWQKMDDSMVAKVLSAPEGTVIQATGSMCTSYHPTGTKGFGKHRVTIRYAKGAKAVESFASGSFASEKEVTTLPNARFVILKREMVPDIEHDKPSSKRLELELLMLPPDLGL